MSVVEALAREVGSVGLALRKLTAEEWSAPTRCDPLNVIELVAHIARGGARISEMIDRGASEDEPEKDAVTYFRFDPKVVGAGVVERAQEVAKELDPAGMIALWDAAWSKGLRGARELLADDDPVLPGIFGLMRLSEYLKTRVVEVTVHHMDLDDAVGKAYHPDAEALEITGDVLRGLLGTDLRAQGMDDVRFVLVGTGRASLSDEERELLGPLADAFPLFA